MHTAKDGSKDSREGGLKSNSRSSQSKPSLIELNINVNSLNDILKTIIETINQHALLLNGLATTSQQKFEKTNFKVLYKNSYTKEVVKGLQHLVYKEDLKTIERGGQKPKEDVKNSQENLPKQPAGYVAPKGVEYKKKVDDIRINKEVVEAEKLLKEYFYMKEFPALIISSTSKISDDVKFLYDMVKQNKAEIQQEFETFKIDNEEKSKAFEKTVDSKIEVLHQEIIKMQEDQVKFCEQTDNKIEEVEKNTLWKMKDYEELLTTRPNKEFVRDITKMECDKVQSFCMKELNSHIPKLERQISTTIQKFDVLSNETIQKVSKMEGDVNILKEGLKLSQSKCDSSYKALKEILNVKFDNFESHMNECKEKDRVKIKRLNQLETDLKEIMENPNFGKGNENTVNEEKLQELTDNLKEELDQKIGHANSEFIKKLELIKEIAIQEALKVSEENQVKFLDKFAKNGMKNDEEMMTMIKEKIVIFEKRIENEKQIIQRKFDKLAKDMNLDILIDKVDKRLTIDIYERFKETLEIKLRGLDKKTKSSEKSITQLESFVENLALAISNMEKKSHEMVVNPAVTQQTFNMACLSCGNKCDK